jgi:5,10-methenyltetrahydromethanopterin hydrogenase
MAMMSARAFAMPVAMGPRCGMAGILTEIFARGLIVFNSSTTCARSSME